MAHNDSKLVNYLAYGGLRAISTLLHCFDVDQNMATLGQIGEIWYKKDRRRRERAINHIHKSFPDMSIPEASDLARRSMRHLLQLFVVEVLFTPRLITPDTWHNYVKLTNVGEAIQIMSGKQPVIFITGHNGNFELLGFTLATVGFPVTALARPLDLPMINDWLMGIRQSRGMNIITKFGATEKLPEIIQSGGHVAFIADQNAGDKGLFVPFFGRLASAYKSIGLLAQRFNVPIVCGQARRTIPDRFQYEISISDIIYPLDWVDKPDPLYYITARYTRAIEMMVREAPEQYFWVHRRWKSRPPHERNGKPVPASLIKKISDLPWINSYDLKKIIDTSNRESQAAKT